MSVAMTDVAVLTTAADELPVAIWMGLVPSGEVVYTNRAFREVLGIEPPEGAARGAFVEPYGVHTLTGEPYPEGQMPFERVLAARATVVIDDIVIHRRDGRHVNLRVIAKPIFDADGNITHVLEAFTDITREVEAERARAEGDRRLARSQRLESIGQLVAGIAHDFNNLLTVTKLAVAWLRSDEKQEERQEALVQIDTVTDTAIQLIRNLLSFAGRERRVMAPFSLEEIVKPLLEMVSRTFDRAISLRVDLAADASVVVGDRSQLEQLLMNLVINARDAISNSGEVIVRTRMHVVAEGSAGECPPGRYVALEVIDTGEGIEAGIRERIFEPYFTTKTAGPVKGTGLGLATVHGIVKAHGGFVEIEDNVPRGTIMRVLLPRPIGVEQPSTAGDDLRATNAPLLRGDGRLILVVDDEPLVRASTAVSLRARGFRVCEAGDAATAIEVFVSHRDEIAAVVLDMVMPEERGRDVYLALRTLRPDVAVLVVTGCTMNAEIQELLDLGVRAWLQKPYDDRQLLGGLERVGLR